MKKKKNFYSKIFFKAVGKKCKSNEFMCNQTKYCIDLTFYCDRIEHCPNDFSDEPDKCKTNQQFLFNFKIFIFQKAL